MNVLRVTPVRLDEKNRERWECGIGLDYRIRFDCIR